MMTLPWFKSYNYVFHKTLIYISSSVRVAEWSTAHVALLEVFAWSINVIADCLFRKAIQMTSRMTSIQRYMFIYKISILLKGWVSQNHAETAKNKFWFYIWLICDQCVVWRVHHFFRFNCLIIFKSRLLSRRITISRCRFTVLILATFHNIFPRFVEALLEFSRRCWTYIFCDACLK